MSVLVNDEDYSARVASSMQLADGARQAQQQLRREEEATRMERDGLLNARVAEIFANLLQLETMSGKIAATDAELQANLQEQAKHMAILEMAQRIAEGKEPAQPTPTPTAPTPPSDEPEEIESSAPHAEFSVDVGEVQDGKFRFVFDASKSKGGKKVWHLPHRAPYETDKPRVRYNFVFGDKPRKEEVKLEVRPEHGESDFFTKEVVIPDREGRTNVPDEPEEPTPTPPETPEIKARVRMLVDPEKGSVYVDASDSTGVSPLQYTWYVNGEKVMTEEKGFLPSGAFRLDVPVQQFMLVLTDAQGREDTKVQTVELTPPTRPTPVAKAPRHGQHHFTNWSWIEWCAAGLGAIFFGWFLLALFGNLWTHMFPHVKHTSLGFKVLEFCNGIWDLGLVVGAGLVCGLIASVIVKHLRSKA